MKTKPTLSFKARQDVRDLLRFGAENSGLRDLRLFKDDLDRVIVLIAARPAMGRHLKDRPGP